MILFFHTGQYLAKEIIEHPDTELAFVWNRTVDKIKDHLPEFVLEDLDDLHSRWVSQDWSGLEGPFQYARNREISLWWGYISAFHRFEKENFKN